MPGQAEQVHLHRDHDLALDQQVGVERQRVERDVDRALDRVLDRDDAEVDLAGRDRVDDVGDRGEVDQVGLGQVGLGEQGLLGERARGPRKPTRRGATGALTSEQDR